MSSRHLASSDDAEREMAVQRLLAAVAERKRFRQEARESAGNKPDDLKKVASLGGADDEVAARRR